MSLGSERCFMATSLIKKKNKKKWKKMLSKWSLIRPNCVQKVSDQTQVRWMRLRSDPISLEVASDQTKVHSKRLWSDPIALEVASGQTKVRSKRLWSDPIALEVASDQTQVRLNPPMIRLLGPQRPLIRPSPDHGPDRKDLELPKRPCNFGLGTHGCALDWVWS